MPSVFISYRTVYRRTAEALHRKLIAQGYEDVFLDRIPRDGLVHGQDFRNQLYHNIRSAGVVLFVVSKGWLESPICKDEYRWALEKQEYEGSGDIKRPGLIPIFVTEPVYDDQGTLLDEPISPEALKEKHQELDKFYGLTVEVAFEAQQTRDDVALTPDQRKEMNRLWTVLEGTFHRYGIARQRSPFDPGRNPYPGLRAHEAILRQWSLLEGWLEEAKNSLGPLNTAENDNQLWQTERARTQGLAEGYAVDRARLYPQERLWLIYDALKALGMPPQRIAKLRDFIRPEPRRLLEELAAKEDGKVIADHARRAQIGNRLNDLRDRRPGIGVFVEAEIKSELEGLEQDESFGFQIDRARPEQLRKILDQRDAVGAFRWDALPDIAWCAVPAGEVEMRLETDGEGKPKDRVVRREIPESFWIAKYPLTIRQFLAFVYPWDETARTFDKSRRSDAYFEPAWWAGFPEDSRENMTVQDGSVVRRKNFRRPGDNPIQEQDPQANFPAQFVNWFQAVAYARWLTHRYRELGLLDEQHRIRLPREWEWQQAATGGHNDRLYPWENGWNPDYCRNRYGQNSPASVGLYPLGDAPTGASDMSGLIVEWCLNKYDDIDDSDETTDDLRPTRGGAYFTFARTNLPAYKPEYANCVHGRLSDHPSGMNDDHRSIRTGVRLLCTGLTPAAEQLVTWENRGGIPGLFA